MAGFRTFATGEVLTAANVNNFLMKQSVMVFADAAARTSALGAEVTEGMLTFNKDTGQLEVFDGTNFVVAAPTQNLVEVKSALFTGTQTASVTAGNNVAVTDLTITHEVADAANRLIISAFIGTASESGGVGRVGLAVDDGSGLIAVGASPGSRTAVTAGGLQAPPGGGHDTVSLAATYVHTPGAGSKTYTVRAINVSGATLTLNINRAIADGDTVDKARGVSGLVIQEVRP